MIILKTVNFGSRRSGLSTVGYTLINADGTTKQARTTTGVSEQGSTGIYRCDIEFDDSWRGFILWDTGEATPLYATEDFDNRQYGGSAGYAIVADNIWSREEKEKLIDKIEKILKALKITESIQENVQEVIAITNKINFKKDFDEIIEKVILLEKSISSLPSEILNDIKDTKESLRLRTDNILKELKKISDIREINIAPIREAISNLSKQVEFSVKIGTKLIDTEALQALLKEDGIDVSKLSIKGIQKSDRKKNRVF